MNEIHRVRGRSDCLHLEDHCILCRYGRLVTHDVAGLRDVQSASFRYRYRYEKTSLR